MSLLRQVCSHFLLSESLLRRGCHHLERPAEVSSFITLVEARALPQAAVRVAKLWEGDREHSAGTGPPALGHWETMGY